MEEFFSDPIVWYSLAVAVLLFVLVRSGSKPAVAFLDGEIAKISNELDAARKLREEAEAKLHEYEEKQRNALAEADAILRHAKEAAARLKIEAEESLKESLARQEERAKDRIRQAEAEALAEVRASTVDSAMELARKILAEQMTKETSEKLVADAISSVGRFTTTKIA